MLLGENGIESGAEGHELRFDALDERGCAKRIEHFKQKLLADIDLGKMWRGEKTADEPFLVLENVEAIADGLLPFESGVTGEGARVDEFADQMLRRAIVPIEIVTPQFRFFVKEWLKQARMELAQIDNVHGWPECPLGRLYYIAPDLPQGERVGSINGGKFARFGLSIVTNQQSRCPPARRGTMLNCAAVGNGVLGRSMNPTSNLKRLSARFGRVAGSLLALVLFVILAAVTISGYLLYQILMPPRSAANVDVTLLMGHPTVYSFDIPGEGSREGWFFPGLLRAPTIVLCHGYGSQRADILTLVTALQEHQFNVFLFDFIGHGGAPGRTTLGYQETRELLAAINGLATREDIDRSRFGVWGTDLGAYAGLAAAVQDPRIEAIAVDSVYDQPSDFLTIQVGHTGLGSLPLVKTFCLFGFGMLNYKDRGAPPLISRLGRLQGIPKLFIESNDKPDLDRETLQMFQIAPPPKDQAADSMTYAEMSDEGRRNYENLVVTFFLQHLPPSGQPAQ